MVTDHIPHPPPFRTKRSKPLNALKPVVKLNFSGQMNVNAV